LVIKLLWGGAAFQEQYEQGIKLRMLGLLMQS